MLAWVYQFNICQYIFGIMVLPFGPNVSTVTPQVMTIGFVPQLRQYWQIRVSRSAFTLGMTLLVYGHVVRAHGDEHGHFLSLYVIFLKYT